MPILMYHGKNDMVVHPQFGQLSFKLIKAMGFKVDLKLADIPCTPQTNMGHSIDRTELRDMVIFIALVLYFQKR